MDSKDFKVDLNNKVLNDYWVKWQAKQPKKDKPEKVPELPKGWAYTDKPESKL